MPCRSRTSTPNTSRLAFIRAMGHRRRVRSNPPRRGTFANPETRCRLRPCTLTPALRGVPSYSEQSVLLVNVGGGGLRHESSYSTSSVLQDVTNAPYDVDQSPCCQASLTSGEHVTGRYRYGRVYHQAPN
ncbi:hypothetical protein MRX96_050449 [Rhipicephalus microplus]